MKETQTKKDTVFTLLYYFTPLIKYCPQISTAFGTKKLNATLE